MARRKNAAALFEVIHSDNRFSPRHQPSSWSPRPPGWLRRMFSRSPSGAAPMPVETLDYAAPEPATQSAPRGGPSLLSRMVSAMPSMPRIGMSLDPERQLVRFQLSYTGALVSAFTVIVAVALAYLAGRGTSHRPMPALTEQTTEELRNGPVLADVLDVGNDATDPPAAMAVSSVPASTGGPTTAQPPQVPTVVTGRQAASRTSLATAQQPNSAQPPPNPQAVRPNQFSEPAAPNVLMVSDANRAYGLQYVIVQSYPEEEKALAESAMATLNQAGVLCTVQRGLPYAPSWYCVVGLTGFSRTRGVPEYDAYINRIMQISNQFAGTSKFKKFEPKPFRWRETTKDPSEKLATPTLKGPTPKQ
jgi:hypothetical protein